MKNSEENYLRLQNVIKMTSLSPYSYLAWTVNRLDSKKMIKQTKP